MADVVNLGEILSTRGEGQNIFGSPAGGTDVVLQFSPAIQYIAADNKEKADADKFKYLQFQENLKNYYKTFDETQVDGVMQKDFASLNDEWTRLASDVAANYDVIRNPATNVEKWTELKEREAALRGKIARSKQDVTFQKYNQDFVAAHPDFNTTENKSKLDAFSSGDLGVRTPFSLETPFSYDPSDVARLANQVAQQKLTEQQSAGRYLEKSEAITYLQGEYDKAWDALHTTQDKSGRPILQAAEDSYNKLPANLRNNVDFPTFYRTTGRNLMLQDSFTKTLMEDPVKAQEDQQRWQAGENAKSRNLQRELAEDKEIKTAGRDYNEALTSGFATGYVRPQLLQNIFGDNNEVEVKNTESDAQGVPTGKVTTIKAPKVQVLGSELGANGELVIKRQDNSSGKPVALPDVTISFEEAREAFKNISGYNNAGKVADAAEKYRVSNNLGINPDLEILRKHFNFSGTSTRTIQSKSGL